MVAALLAIALLPLSCAALRNPFSSPIEDQTVSRWCGVVQRGVAVYKLIMDDFEGRAVGGMKYELAMSDLRRVGKTLITECENDANGTKELTSSEMNGVVQEGAHSLAALVRIHRDVMAPTPRFGELRVVQEPGPSIHHDELLRELMEIESEALASMARR